MHCFQFLPFFDFSSFWNVYVGTCTWDNFGVYITWQLRRFVVISRNFQSNMWKHLMGTVLLNAFPNQDLKKKNELQNTSKQLKSNIKGLNLTLLKPICFTRTFITCSYYSTRTFSTELLSSEHLFLKTCFLVNYFCFDELY